MSQVEAPNYLRKWEFGDSACYAELPKVADAVIEANCRPLILLGLFEVLSGDETRFKIG